MKSQDFTRFFQVIDERMLKLEGTLQKLAQEYLVMKVAQSVPNESKKSDISGQIEKLKEDLILEVGQETFKRSIKNDEFKTKVGDLQKNVEMLNDTISNYIETTRDYNVTLERQVARLQNAIDSTNLSKTPFVPLTNFF